MFEILEHFWDWQATADLLKICSRKQTFDPINPYPANVENMVS
jgi:hypothetical protein